MGGWDFWFHSDPINKVYWGLQTYHHKSSILDFLDVDFEDNGVPKSIRFYADQGELGWYHDRWTWSQEGRQAAPVTMFCRAKNSDYIVEVSATIARELDGEEVLTCISMVSDVTPLTSLYVIQSLYPVYEGKIYRNKCGCRGEVVAEFGGIGGGEFSFHKSIFEEINPILYKYTFGLMYTHPLPYVRKFCLFCK